MCGQRRDWLSPKKLTHPTPGGFRGLYIQCSFVNSYVRPFLTLASSARYRSACVWYFFRPIAGSSARLNDRCTCEACSFNGKFVVDDTLLAIRQTTPTVRAQPSSICRTLPIYYRYGNNVCLSGWLFKLSTRWHHNLATAHSSALCMPVIKSNYFLFTT